MATFLVLRHPVATLVKYFTNPGNLTNYLLTPTLIIEKSLDDVIRCDNKFKQAFFIFNTREYFSEKKRLMRKNLSGTYQGEPRTGPS